MREQSWVKIRALARSLQEGPQEVRALAKTADVKPRTIYRWLKTIEHTGADVVRRVTGGVITYQINNAIDIG